ncbi:MAG: hypothetical protein AAGI03_00510, partial [Pseudomonadota bacterium]
ATFQPYQIGINSDPDSGQAVWGSEAEFVWQMRQAGDNRPVYVIKLTRDGSSLHDDWDPTKANDNFAKLVAKVARARELLTGVNIGPEVYSWNGGEADANVGAGPGGNAAAQYNPNFTLFFSEFRNRISPSAFIVVQRIRPLGYEGADVTDNAAGRVRAWTVREAQIAVPLADGNAATISTDFDQSNFGQIHPTEPWIEGMGARSFAAWQGTYTATYGSITDSVPDAFSFADVIEAVPNSTVQSDVIEISGIERQAAVSVTGGEFRTLSILDGNTVVTDWTTTGFVDKFQAFQLRTTSSPDLSTAVSVTVTAGGVSDTWTVTTYASAPSFRAETTAFIDQVAANGGAAITGADASAIDAFYAAATDASWWPKLLRLYLRIADETASRLDLKGQAASLTDTTGGANLAYNWTRAAGWKAPSQTNLSSLNMQVNPSTDMPQNDSGVILWLNAVASGVGSARILMANNDQKIRFNMRDSGAQTLRLHSAETDTEASVPVLPGMRGMMRSNATQVVIHGPDGSVTSTETQASEPVAATSLYIGNTGAVANANAEIHGAAACSAALTTAEMQSLSTIAQTLLDHFEP